MEFVRTIGEDVQVSDESEDSSSDEEAVQPKAFPSNRKKGHGDFMEDFEFTEKSLTMDSDWTKELIGIAKKRTRPDKLSTDEKIAKLRRERKKKEVEAVQQKESPEEKSPESVDDEVTEKTTNIQAAPAEKQGSCPGETLENDSDSEYSSEDEEIGIQELDAKWDQVKNQSLSEKRIQRRKKKEIIDKETFFEDLPEQEVIESFQNMNLSRPLLKAITAMNFVKPTPIQSSTIPVALLGKDICACAATGTGKTAAFMLPVLERLLYKPKQAPVTRVLVLVPTRELGVQVYNVSKQLSQFTSVEICLAVGGLDVKVQEAALRRGPDVLIATPGRLIDHIHNAPTFNLNSIEILILDEADRMLDEFFQEQMKEVIRMCALNRQTMLFSATMSDEVEDLVMVSLKNPVRIFVNENTDVAYNLRQEFIRIRPGREGDREAIVSALCCRTFHDHCLIFVQTKRQAHRLHIILGLLGLNVGELHGNLTQSKRLESLRKFKEDQVDVLVATDLAARGLDIEGVKTVINFTMPNSPKHYVHRVGRTARAGKSGRSISLIGETERKQLKDIIKKAKNPVKSRIVPQEVIHKYRDKIESLEEDIDAVYKMEREEKEMKLSELQIHKAETILKHSDEIASRPKRVWFQSHKERKQLEESQRLDGGRSEPQRKKQKTRKERKKEEDADARAEYDLMKAQQYAIREAKRQRRGGKAKIRAFDDKPRMNGKTGSGNKKKTGGKSSFEKELTSTSARSLRQFRSKTKEARKESFLAQKKKSKQQGKKKR